MIYVRKELYETFSFMQIKNTIPLFSWFSSFFSYFIPMNSVLLSILAFLSRMIILRHKPYVIGVTGTVGKTTITTHIARYLKKIYGEEAVMISPYHYNGEYGLPLSILWARTGGKNPFLWLWVLAVFIKRLLFPYPRYLILEYGIDHPGEMEFLLSIVIPDIAILTPVAPNHLEQFGSLENYRNDKLLITRDAPLLIAHESLRPYIDREALFYGIWGMSDIDASHFSFSLERWIWADIHLHDIPYHIQIKALWAYQIENILPLYAIAEMLSLDPLVIEKQSHIFLPESGRSSLIHKNKNTTIIDGSYNGGYESICKSIDAIIPFLPSHRVFFFFWDMRELGDHAWDIHTKLAEYIIEKIPTERNVAFFLVGPLMQKFVFPLLSKQYSCCLSLSSRTLGDEIAIALEREDVPTIITVKWSQNTIFLEEGMKKFLDTKDHIHLTRQSDSWMKKKEVFFQTIDGKVYNKMK